MKHLTCFSTSPVLGRFAAPQTRSARSWLLLAGSLLALSGCAEDPEEGCTATRDTYAFSEDTSIGFTMSEALANRRAQTSTLTWAEPRDWLSHSASGDTELVVHLSPIQGEQVEEIRNESTDCFRVLRTVVDVHITSEDGQLITGARGTITAHSKSRFELVVDLENADLEGDLQIGADVQLQLRQTVSGQNVTGTLSASTQSEATLRSFDLATWSGSVSAVEPSPGPTDDAPTDDVATDDSHTDDVHTGGDAGPSGDTDSGIEPLPPEAGAPDAGVEAGGPVDDGPTSDSGMPDSGSSDAAASADAAGDAG